MGKQADIELFVDASREVDGWKHTIASEGETPARKEALKAAIGRRSEYERRLTGGQLGQARRLLQAPLPVKPQE